MDNLPEVQQIFRDVLDSPSLVLTRDSNASNVDNWDSLSHINLIMSIERKYKIKFALGELKDMESVGDLLNVIADKLNAK